MINLLPQKLKNLAAIMRAPLYVVGGSCRDFIARLDRAQHDWDICAPASAEEVCVAAEKVGLEISAVYKNTGTVRLKGENEEYEFTSFRTDKYVRGEHSPKEVYFTDDIALDARRRDFKCNAVYYDIVGGQFIDPLGGIPEIEGGIISTVAAAEKVFGEDGLRLMRLCRIAAQTGFKPDDDDCVSGAKKNCALIGDIAPERIWAELDLILHADQKYGKNGAQYDGLKLLHRIGVLEKILPELALGDGMYQREDFHAHDVLEHTFRCVLYAPNDIRLAALLHDAGKPYCMNTTGRFARHEEAGERIARDICARLRVSKRQTERVCELVRWHMYDIGGVTSENKVKKFIVAHYGVLDELLMLKQADYSACKDDLSVAPVVKRWKNILSSMVSSGVPMTLKELKIRGDELIGAGICPDEVGKTLNFLLGECAIGAVAKEKERLLKLALSQSGARKGR
ncbi:MAG: HD domain-containing protein [Clostridia bacterium]|nr:HD domain-containing protein [Clostridia bacterium]